MRCHIRGSSSQVEGKVVGEKVQTVKSVMTGRGITAGVRWVDGAAVWRHLFRAGQDSSREEALGSGIDIKTDRGF